MAIMKMMLLVRVEVHKGTIARTKRREKKENMAVEPG